MIIHSSNVLTKVIPQSKKKIEEKSFVEEIKVEEEIKTEKVARKNKVKKDFIEEEVIPSYREED